MLRIIFQNQDGFSFARIYYFELLIIIDIRSGQIILYG